MMKFSTVEFDYFLAGTHGPHGFADLDGNGTEELIVGGPVYPWQNIATPFRAIDLSGGTIQLANYDSELTQVGAVHAREVVVADFNGDGIDDFFSANHGYDQPPFPGEVNTLVLSLGNGVFEDRTSTLPQYESFTHSAVSGDIDSDGDIDIFVGTLGRDTTGPYFLRNDGLGNFTYDTLSLPAYVRDGDPTDAAFTSSLLTDINSDQHLDLVLGRDQNGRTAGYTYLNNGDGTFDSQSFSELPSGYFGVNNTIVTDVAALDLNRDGFQDLLAASTGFEPFYHGSGLQYFQNDGSGGYVDKTSEDLFVNQISTEEHQASGGTGWVHTIIVSDVNSDGFDDLVLAGGQDDPTMQPVIVINDGNGNLHEYHGSAISDFKGSVTPIDLNSDGQMDFISMRGYWKNLGTEDFTNYIISAHTVAGVDALFDDWYYHSVNSDVAAAGISAKDHYQSSGWMEGRDPNALFDTSQYLANNPDVAAAGINPLSHFLDFGYAEGRDDGLVLDVYRYANDHADVAQAGINPLVHYLTWGAANGRVAYDDFGNLL